MVGNACDPNLKTFQNSGVWFDNLVYMQRFVTMDYDITTGLTGSYTTLESSRTLWVSRQWYGKCVARLYPEFNHFGICGRSKPQWNCALSPPLELPLKGPGVCGHSIDDIPPLATTNWHPYKFGMLPIPTYLDLHPHSLLFFSFDTSMHNTPIRRRGMLRDMSQFFRGKSYMYESRGSRDGPIRPLQQNLPDIRERVRFTLLLI